MSRLSSNDADKLRSWLELTSAIHVSKGSGVATPSRPTGWMILAHLSLQSTESAPYADLRVICGLETAAALSQAIARLEDKGYVSSFAHGNDTRAKEARLTAEGRNAVGKILHRPFPRLR
jgi:DNA-binding MarR family transcriptional regulator